MEDYEDSKNGDHPHDYQDEEGEYDHENPPHMQEDDSEAEKLREDFEEGEGDFDRGEGVNALNLKWVLGYNKDIKDGVHNLTGKDRSAIFYSAAHTGVIYDYEDKEQKLLQGHCNKITCTA
jgi:hypothetical protein